MTTNKVQSTQATAADLSAHTEQALVELIYVRAANEMIGSAMGSLDSALNTTQSVLNILQGLQNLKNQVSVKSKSAFNFDYLRGTFNSTQGLAQTHVTYSVGGPGTTAIITIISAAANVTAYQHNYGYAASQYFGKAIDPFFVFSSPTDPSFAQFSTSLAAYKNSLIKEINVLTQQTPVAARNDPNGLLANLKQVLAQLPQDPKNFASVEKWVLDNYNTHGSSLAGSAGALQNQLTFAITAAQQLNDTQKEKVRRFLFIFQQYYQSAAAVISAMNQIITQMAQKLSQ